MRKRPRKGGGQGGGGEEEAGERGALDGDEAGNPPGVPEEIANQGAPEPGGELNGGVLPGDFCAAVSAAGAEEEPGEDGDVVEPANGMLAVRAVGARADDGRAMRDASNADVEEGAEKEAEEEAEDLEGE